MQVTFQVVMAGAQRRIALLRLARLLEFELTESALMGVFDGAP
jgi:hypothetical protein